MFDNSFALNRHSVIKSLFAFGLSAGFGAGSGTALAQINTAKKPLIVYFSMPETDDPKDMTEEEENSTVVINGKVLGNTQYIALLIQKYTGGDLFRIEAKKPYPTLHKTLVDLAKEEQNQNARPALLRNIENLKNYDTIFLGYPNWWGDMPMILYTFLQTHDLSGKTVIPFNTHGGSGFSRTISTIQELAPKANVITRGFTVYRDRVDRAEPDLKAWVQRMGWK
jgi:putative flavodoxin